MKYKLAYVALCLALGASGACGDDAPRPDGGGGRGGDGSAGTGGMGGMGGMGGAGGSGGATDGPRETNPTTDGPMTEGGIDGGGMPMATVTPAGKRLTSADGRLTIEIPPGAFRGPTDVEISVLASPPGGALGAVYEIEPLDEPLLVPARVIFRYTAGELAGGKASDLRIGFRVGTSWQALSPTAADAATTEIRSTLSRLGVIGLLPGLCDVCDASCDPATCKVGITEQNPAGVAGKCADHGKGCKKCVPMCDDDGDGFCEGDPPMGEAGGDCADDDAARYPGAREICGNLLDDDCDTHLDEGCKTCTAQNQCPSSGEGCLNGICDVCETGCTPSECAFGGDPENMVPGAMGRCHTFGNGCASCVPMCDNDGDGYCPAANPGNEQPGGDCDDNNPTQHPGVKEVCGNGLDDDCNGSVDDLCTDCDGDEDCSRDLQVCRNSACAGCARACDPAAACMYESEGTMMAGKCSVFGRNDSCSRCVPMCDADADGFCEGDPPGGEPGGDCRVNNPDVSPAAVEICDNDEDDNCNSIVDEGCTLCSDHAGCPTGNACENRLCTACEVTCVLAECRFGAVEGMPDSGVAGRCAAYGMGCQRCVPSCDADGDGFCPAANPGNDQPGGDCDDANVAAYPGAAEICGNRIDESCDGRKDEDCATNTCSASAMCGNNESCSTAR